MSHGPVPKGVPTYASRAAMYESLIKEMPYLIDAAPPALAADAWGLHAHMTQQLANAASSLFYAFNAQAAGPEDAPLHALPVNWVGFYIRDPTAERLVLGPFQGKVACSVIKLGKGVCGTAVTRDADRILADVHEEPTHIACDAASESEAVLVLRAPGGMPVGVLDIDSAVLGFFTPEADAAPLREIASIISKALALAFGSIERRARLTRLSAAPAAAAPAAAGASAATAASSAAASAAASVGLEATRLPTAVPAFRVTKVGPAPSAAAASGSPFTSAAVPPPRHLPVDVHAPRRQGTPGTLVSPTGAPVTPPTAPPADENFLRVKGWELRHRSVNEMLPSARHGDWEERLGVNFLPEIIFDQNELHFTFAGLSSPSSTAAAAPAQGVKFNVSAFDAIRNAAAYYRTDEFAATVKNSMFPPAQKAWAAQRAEFETYDPQIDWAFRNTYAGTWALSVPGGEPAAIPPTVVDAATDPSLGVDYAMLRRTDMPIRFWCAWDLFEDDLHDSGESKMSLKCRAMDECFFVLVRHIVRLDAVRLVVRDSRHFHKFGSDRVVVETSVRALDVEAVMASHKQLSVDDVNRIMLKQPEEIDPAMLKPVSTVVEHYPIPAPGATRVDGPAAFPGEIVE